MCSCSTVYRSTVALPVIYISVTLFPRRFCCYIHALFFIATLHFVCVFYLHVRCSNRVAIGFETPEDEKFYGFGVRFGDCNQRGHRVGSWLEDGSFGLGVIDPDKWKLRV